MPDTTKETPAEDVYDLDESQPQEQASSGTQTPPTASAAAPAATPPQPPSKPAWLTEQARELGFSDAEIDTFSADQLGAACTRMRRRLDAERSEWVRKGGADQGQPTQAPAPEADEPLTFAVNPETGEPYDKELHPELVGKLKSLHQELQATKKQLKQRDQLEQQRQLSARSVALDDAFDGIDRPDLFGKGSITEVSPAEAKRRNSVLLQAGISEVDSGRAIERKIKSTASELYPAAPASAAPPVQDYEPEPEPAPKKPSKAVADWNRGGVAKPTQRSVDDLPPGKERAARNLSKNAGKYGLTPEVNEQSELNGALPE